ncbi:MAG: DUF4347 domain-containing protein [Cyanobacteria bacterium P01_F01_bin.143]
MLLTKDNYLAIQKATIDYLAIQGTTKLVVIDPAVKDSHQLAEDVPAEAKVLLLDSNQDSIAQITKALAAGNYHSLHLVSHGSTECLPLGSTNLTFETITQYKPQLMEWGIAEIFIYGCNMAKSSNLLKQLHYLVGANIVISAGNIKHHIL